MLCNIRKKKVAVLLMGPNEWLLYWFLFEGLILNDFLISPGLPPLPWFGVRSPCSYSKVFAYAALPPPLVKAGGLTDDWKVNGRMKWGGWRVCLTGNWVLEGNEKWTMAWISWWLRLKGKGLWLAIALLFGLFQDNSFRSRLVAARDRGFNYSSLTSRDPSSDSD